MLLYNTISRKKEEFVPARDGRVGMYVCGITTYDLCHVGHARSAVVFDVLVRYLRHKGLEVTLVRNFTDVDDKIINRANSEGIPADEVSRKYIQAFYEDMDALGVLRADVEPKATEHIEEMIRMCEGLIASGKAYATSSGDVYFRVRAYPGYGALSGRNIEELKAGARIQPGEEKEDPLDFALWKGAKPGEPSWPSPWGPGRPGWHIECSAMSEKYLPLPLDIHGGGQDLIFPHHENEIAQTGAATGKDLARFWVHNGFVQINSEKMSKSLGNFFTIRDILGGFLPEVLRFFLLTKHYRSPLDFTFEAMEEAERSLKRIYSALAQIGEFTGRDKWAASALPADVEAEIAAAEDGIAKAMEDDLNSAAALGHVFSLIRLAGRVMDDKGLKKSAGARDGLVRIAAAVADWGGVLGLFGTEPGAFLANLRDKRIRRKEIDPARVEALLTARQEARQAKDFARSDAVRDELAALGIEVKDTPRGQEWDVL